MPYIKEYKRRDFDKALDTFPPLMSPGEANYAITRLLNMYVHQHGECYYTFQDAIGILECAKIEFYRRRVAPYEDEKCAEHGDVYP